MGYFGGIFGLVILVLDIVAIVDCVKQSMDTGMKVLVDRPDHPAATDRVDSVFPYWVGRSGLLGFGTG